MSNITEKEVDRLARALSANPRAEMRWREREAVKAIREALYETVPNTNEQQVSEADKP